MSLKDRGEMSSVTLIVFSGGHGQSPVEQMVAGAHHAVVRDTLEKASSSGAFDRAIVVTDSDELTRQLQGSAELAEVGLAEVELDRSTFHFGRKLSQVIRGYGVAKPFYLGGGASPLMTAAELASIARQLEASHNTVITNNLYSADLVAFTPGEAIERVEPPALDNPLAQLLGGVGLSVISLPPTTATLFDIDTPTDLLVLRLHPGAATHTRVYLEDLDLDLSRLRRAVALLGDVNAEVLVAGRVGSYLWSRLERDTSCRVRTLAEERGMRADGREERGRVHGL